MGGLEKALNDLNKSWIDLKRAIYKEFGEPYILPIVNWLSKKLNR